MGFYRLFQIHRSSVFNTLCSSPWVFWVYCAQHYKAGATVRSLENGLDPTTHRLRLEEPRSMATCYCATSAASALFSNMFPCCTFFRDLLHAPFLVTFLRGRGEAAGIFFPLAMFLQCFMLYFTNLFSKTQNETCSSVIEMDQVARTTNWFIQKSDSSLY